MEKKCTHVFCISCEVYSVDGKCYCTLPEKEYDKLRRDHERKQIKGCLINR